MEDSKLRPPHQPKMQRGDVRVTDESLGVAAEYIRVEVGNDPDRSIPTGRRNCRFCGVRSERLGHRSFSKRIIYWPLLDSEYVGYVGEGAGPGRGHGSRYSEYAGQPPKRNWGRNVLSERFRVEI